MRVGATAIFSAQAHFVITTRQSSGSLTLKTGWPVAAVRGGTFGNGVFAARNVVRAEDCLVGAAKPDDLQSVGRRRS
jgi:hypothetical protein